MTKHKCPFVNLDKCPSRCKSMHRLTETHWCYDSRYGLPGEVVCEEDNKSKKVKHLGENINTEDIDVITPRGYLTEADLLLD